MEYEDHEAQDSASLSFPAGLVLLLTFLFCSCCFFCCCLHWEKLRSFLGCPDHHNHAPPPLIRSETAVFSDQKIAPFLTLGKQNESQSLTVLMPGDQVPRFIAMARRCEPAAASFMEVSVVVQKPAAQDPDSNSEALS